jgi:hypothetical protein
MDKTSRVGEKLRMSRYICADVSTSGKVALQKSVERIIKQNQKVFDNLAKS